MFEMDLRSKLPIYEQLVMNFKKLIISEVLKTDEQLPSVRVLSGQLTINPNTIQKAYRELEAQGYIYSIPGKGSFVAPVVPNENAEKLMKLKEELMKLLLESMYLGLENKDILQLIENAEAIVKGGPKND
jgi:GntR family transcriptional regulator